jgi:hypothetical protein
MWHAQRLETRLVDATWRKAKVENTDLSSVLTTEDELSSLITWDGWDGIFVLEAVGFTVKIARCLGRPVPSFQVLEPISSI